MISVDLVCVSKLPFRRNGIPFGTCANTVCYLGLSRGRILMYDGTRLHGVIFQMAVTVIINLYSLCISVAGVWQYGGFAKVREW